MVMAFAEKGVALFYFIVNLLIPGLGSLLGGLGLVAVVQLLLFFLSLVLAFTLVGLLLALPLFLISWIWALVSSLGLLKRA